MAFQLQNQIYVENTKKVVVKSGYKKIVKAYLNLLYYNYELWEKDLKYDDYYDKVTVSRPVIVIFTISKDIRI